MANAPRCRVLVLDRRLQREQRDLSRTGKVPETESAPRSDIRANCGNGRRQWGAPITYKVQIEKRPGWQPPCSRDRHL